MAALKDCAGKLRNKREELAKYFEKKTADGRFDWTAEDRDKVKDLNKEANDLADEFKKLRADVVLEKKNKRGLNDLNRIIRPGFSGKRDGNDGARLDYKGVGDHFIEQKSFTGRQKGSARDWSVKLDGFQTKTLFQTTAGWDPFVTRQPGVTFSPQQQPRVVDVLPALETDQHSIKWMLETLYSNAAAATSEGGTFPEAQLVYTEQLTPVQKVAVFIPATDEMFEDAPRTRDILNNRLTLMLRQKIDQYLLTGTGVSPQLLGMLNLTGILTQAKSTDPSPSAFYKAMTQIRFTGFAEPSAILMNPIDWQNIKLLQTADGLYIWGHPSDETVNRMWGLPVVATTYQTLGTGLVGDFQMFMELYWRRGIEFLISNSHASFFIQGMQAIRADVRLALVCRRPTALCTVTGL